MPHTRLQSQVLAQRQRKPEVGVRLRATGTLGSWAKITRNGRDHGMSLFKQAFALTTGKLQSVAGPVASYQHTEIISAERAEPCYSTLDRYDCRGPIET